MRTVSTFVLALSLATTSCSGLNGSGADSDVRNVFGTDDRVPMTDDAYPWSAVVRLSSGCTGALVGRNLVLTAAHCVIYDNGTLRSDIAVWPNYRDGVAVESANMIAKETRIGGGTSRTRISDWAVMVIDQDLGDRFGAFDVSESRSDYTKLAITAPGYSVDFRQGNTAGVASNCAIRAFIDGVLWHDCDLNPGASGGPIFILENGQYRIIGVSNAHYPCDQGLLTWSSSCSNLAAPSGSFQAVVKNLGGHAIVVASAPKEPSPSAITPHPEPAPIPTLTPEPSAEPNDGPMPRGKHWFSLFIPNVLGPDAMQVALDACAREVQRALPGVTCWRKDFQWISAECFDPQNRELEINAISCVKSANGPSGRPYGGYSDEFKPIPF